ncbi:FAD-dependent oxidoreductase [Clostridium estertheticum]|uniref:oxidoreductase n=1 Tax=Clostridium estertheticum TaxID=238834 RepID=UPI001C0DF503|nr:FAD-dependent oxidoreductase [Clostridium estertheticum]MBU3200351.1 FAD-dependent oxidoreductase [Clostridium estertheticum]WAG67185.1 FAD-dependent oxidoreductase [Clostridium estertheticum]
MITELFKPMNIAECTVPNRLVVPAMVTNFCTKEGMVTERFIKYIEEKAKGGWGLIITEDYAVNVNGKGYEMIPGLYNDEQIEGNKKLTETIHKYGSKLFCQLYHPGRQSTKLVNGNVIPLAPSAIKDPICQEAPKEMTVEDIKSIVKDFGETARRVKEAGFDGIEIHAAHGYLISEFLSHFTNKRVDEYGGCFDNRARFLDEIIEAVRKKVGKDFPVIVRISGNEYLLGGRTEAESFELARHCEEIGFDAIHVSNGMYASAPIDQIIAPMYTKHALNMEVSEQVKKLVNVPVIVTNRINDPKMADTLLKMGKADFIGMGRGSLADPHLPEKAKAGKFDSIHYCIGCLQGCEDKLLKGESITCLINPRVGCEYENDMKKVEKAKKVMVIGAGPGGLTAAYTAAMRGHNVTVFEKKNDLGGQFKSAAYPLGKGELATFVSSVRKVLKDLNVPIHLNTEVTEELIQNEKPDSIIIATGAVSFTPNIKGINLDKVVTAEEVLLGNCDVKADSVVVCGGGEVGGETAHFLSQTIRDITIVEMKKDILNDMMIMTKICLTGYLHESNIKVLTEATVNEINAEGVVYTNATGEKSTLPAQVVISAFGYKSYNPLEEVAKKYSSEVHVIGGAIKAASALHATKDGYAAGLVV